MQRAPNRGWNMLSCPEDAIIKDGQLRLREAGGQAMPGRPNRVQRSYRSHTAYRAHATRMRPRAMIAALAALAICSVAAPRARAAAAEFSPDLSLAQELIAGASSRRATIPPDAPERTMYPLATQRPDPL